MGEALAHTASSLTRWLDKPVTALLGSDVLLTCSFPAAPCGAGEGDGQRRVTWYFQGQALMELDGIAVTTRKGAESLPLSCPGATLRSSCPASRWPSRAPKAAPCATGGSAERAASANGWQGRRSSTASWSRG
ncbi:unnamed protein product [Natator depressus]